MFEAEQKVLLCAAIRLQAELSPLAGGEPLLPLILPSLQL